MELPCLARCSLSGVLYAGLLELAALHTMRNAESLPVRLVGTLAVTEFWQLANALCMFRKAKLSLCLI